MPGISNNSKNDKTLSNADLGADIIVDEATMTIDDAERPVDFLGNPVTKKTKNNKTLTNSNENL